MKITEVSNFDGKKTAVFSFARMNPPTVGHQKLIGKVISEAQAMSSPYFIMISHTVDKKKNPLPYDIKMKFIKSCFPSIKFMDAVTLEKDGETKTVKTPFEMLEYLCQQGYRNAIMVVGADRVENFENMIRPYIGKDFDLDSFKVISAGERTGEETNEQASGTLVRQLVKMDMKDEFDKFIPTTNQKIKDELFDELKKYL
ncbi:MAG: hypothetical protein M0R77_21065 [Gammaproteobacteria bacterium]|nr:hypothetical protein [Gammaproteobacteria bacterium]